MRYLGREHLRWQRATAEAMRIASMDRDDYTAWHRDISRAVGTGD